MSFNFPLLKKLGVYLASLSHFISTLIAPTYYLSAFICIYLWTLSQEKYSHPDRKITPPLPELKIKAWPDLNLKDESISN